MLQGYGTKEGTPFLYLFDSFPGNRAEAIQNIRDYLSQEWFEKKVKLEAFRRKNFSADEMVLIEPVKPEQNNEYDCGIYLLTYIEKIFNDIEIFIGEKTVAQKNLATWFSMEKISCQRKIIKSTIFELAEEQNPSNLYTYRASELASNDKYKEWLQNLASAEFHYRRGYDEESEDESDVEEKSDVEEEKSDVGEESDEEEELGSAQLLIERREEETDSVKNLYLPQQHQTAELIFVKSPDRICDIKDEPSIIGNIWKNRLRSKAQKRK